MGVDITPEILSACRSDNRKAINVLYEHCFKFLMPVCFRYNNNEEDARASFNSGFMKILNGLKKTDEELNFHAWAKRIMVNSLIDEYRKNKKYNEQISKSDDEKTLDFYSSGAVNDAEGKIGYENILMLVKELPESTALVFNMYVIEGYSHKEIAEALEMSEGTSKWHLSTARKMLREKLERLENQNQRLVI